MIATIHQPEHIPWLGFFHKMSLSDVFVVLDTVQFEKNNWQNRNKLISRAGDVFWQTIPVQNKGILSCAIRDVLVDPRSEWQRKYLGRLNSSYCRHPFFNEIMEELQGIFSKNHARIADLNLELICLIRKYLGLSTEIIRASNLGASGRRSELLLDICKGINATVYLSGPSGRNYLDKSIFEDAGIRVDFHEFSPPVYPAPHKVPGLSALDLLFNHGMDSRFFLKAENE